MSEQQDFPAASDRDIVVYRTRIDDDGGPVATVALTPAGDTRPKIVATKAFVIPVVFLPGIMGTNLRKRGTNEVAWRPPNVDLRGSGEVLAAFFSYLAMNARERQSALTTDDVEVDPMGPLDDAGTDWPKHVLRARGWGTVMRSSYHPLLGRLERELNALAIYDFEAEQSCLQSWARDQGQDPPADWGAANAPALTEDELKYAANYRFDVWAAGYNWLKSNADSGLAVKDFIENTVLPYYNQGKPVTSPGASGKRAQIKSPKPGRDVAKGVIVVTHSMGGLVSRALTEIHNCEHVLGVVHGVQPATGAPATYKRMRGGFEGAEQVILGRDAGEVTAVLAQAPGGLELLPSFDYNGGKPWLKVRDEVTGAEPLQLPKNGDPYNEIYASPKWYGLVPEGSTGLMAPASSARDEQPGKSKAGNETPRTRLAKALEAVEKFHRAIAGRYRLPTYAHYGAQARRNSDLHRGGLLGTGLLAASERFAWSQVVWQGREVANMDADRVEIVKDDFNGTIMLADGRQLSIAKPDAPGDGTVPEPSGAAPGKAGVAVNFIHGQGNPGARNARFGYDHQASYNDDRAVFATLYSVVKIAQCATWHKDQ